MKLSLGTVQLGLAYGVNNAVGRLSDDEADAVLEAAYQSGFELLDTSLAYGAAIERIERFLRRRPGSLEMVAKFHAALSPDTIRSMQAEHKQYISHNLLWTSGQDIASLDASLADGVTVYTVEEAEQVSDAFKWVQVPASVLDGRMDDEIQRLQAKGKTVLVRSLLLQGLLAADPVIGPVGVNGNPALPDEARPFIADLRVLATKYSMSVVELAVRWVWTIGPDVAVIGAETPNQVREIALAWKRGPLPSGLISKLRALRKGVPELVISPRMWKQTAYEFTT